MIQGFKTLFRHSRGWLFHSGALLYSVCAFGLGFTGLFHPSLAINLPAMLLLAHGMVIAAYLVHECAHNTIFKANNHNAKLGSFLTWMCGASYAVYDDIRYKHFRHHIDNDDVVWFDYEGFFRNHPLIYRITIFLEWFYIPAHDLIMHFILVFGAFIIPQRRNQRLRNLTVIFARAGCFALLCWFSWKAAALYVMAYLLMMTVLRFMDSLQHDYPYHTNLFEGDRSERKGDRDWEQIHTFSNFISVKYPVLNLLVLNFCYHNAHHAKTFVPWFELPALHKEMFGDDPAKVIDFWPQIRIFHRYRAYRIFHDAPGLSDVEGRAFLRAAQQSQVTGGNAASFLTPF